MLEGIVAELVTAGCSGGDWDAVEEGWDLHRYRAMQKHWTEVAPPAYVTSAAAAGFRPRESPSAGGGDFIDNPDDLARALAGMTGGRIIEKE